MDTILSKNNVHASHQNSQNNQLYFQKDKGFS